MYATLTIDFENYILPVETLRLIMTISFNFFQHVISEPFEPSPFMPAVTKAFESDFDGVASRQQRGQTDMEAPVGSSANEKENSTRENNVAKIKVVVC